MGVSTQSTWGTKPPAVLKAIQKALDHAKAIGNVDAKGVLPVDDFVAINSALGHMIKSSGEAATMSTYNAFKGIVADSIPTYLLSTVNPSDAKAAYSALMTFKDTVKR